MNFVIPVWLGLLLFGLAWVGISCVISMFLNHQTPENKRKNAIVSFGFTMLLASWAILAAIYTGRPVTWDSTLRLTGWLVSGWLLLEVGDMLAFLLAIIKGSPGGVRGWIWRKIALHLTSMRDYAASVAESALRPSEVKLIDRHIVEGNTADTTLQTAADAAAAKLLEVADLAAEKLREVAKEPTEKSVEVKA